MDCLKSSTIRLIHDKVLRKYGGNPGIKDPDALENIQSYVLMVTEAMDETWDEINIIILAAYQIVKNHIFWDANKRTAQFLILNCLRQLGYFYTGRPKDLSNKLIEFAASDSGQKREAIYNLSYFIKAHLQK